MIGVLALQGNYALHQQALQSLGHKAPLIYNPSELAGLDGLVVPGGESTALLKLMTPLNWQDAIADFRQSGKRLFGTCAGMILFARDVSPQQQSLDLIDISVERNAYGRQLESKIARGACDAATFGASSCEMVFIRAPMVTRVGEGVSVLATYDDVPVLVQKDNVLCASYHPEMSEDNMVHKYFFAD